MQQMISKSLGRRVRRVRQEKGLTLKEVEAKVGVSATHISEIERGNSSPTIQALERIAKALGVPASLLIDIPPLPCLRVRRPGDRRLLSMERGILMLDPLTDCHPSSEISYFVATVTSNGPVALGTGNRTEAFCYMQDGIVELVVDGASNVLRKGDAIHFKSTQAPRVRNLAPSPSRMLWATRPRLYL